jgi:hypothetical protein
MWPGSTVGPVSTFPDPNRVVLLVAQADPLNLYLLCMDCAHFCREAAGRS